MLFLLFHYCSYCKYYIFCLLFKLNSFVRFADSIATTLSELRTFDSSTLMDHIGDAPASAKKGDKMAAGGGKAALDRSSYKAAFDKARLYIEKKELPADWSRSELLGYSSGDESAVSLHSLFPVYLNSLEMQA